MGIVLSRYLILSGVTAGLSFTPPAMAEIKDVKVTGCPGPWGYLIETPRFDYASSTIQPYKNTPHQLDIRLNSRINTPTLIVYPSGDEYLFKMEFPASTGAGLTATVVPGKHLTFDLTFDDRDSSIKRLKIWSNGSAC